MKIIFTGGSSFTGFWFIKTLAEAGHDITAVFTQNRIQYKETRKERVERICNKAKTLFGCSFGDEQFLALIRSSDHWDILCHHGAYVADYKSMDFDIPRAVAENTRGLKEVLKILKEKNCRKIVLTGSVFEAEEGDGTRPLTAFSPYALSKKMTADMFRFFCDHYEMSMGKFVIPNPFGPFEEKRFIHYLITSWLAGKTPVVRTPDYVRDNVHVSLLSLAYQGFVESLPEHPGFYKRNPSGYRESQKEFSHRVADNIGRHLSVSCPVEFVQQMDFTEPLKRVNTEPIADLFPAWDENTSWRELAGYYLGKQGACRE